jgi:hypothetical protein
VQLDSRKQQLKQQLKQQPKQQLKQQLKQLKRLKGLKAEAKILMRSRWPVGSSAMRGFTKVQESSTGICLSCLKLLRFEDM